MLSVLDQSVEVETRFGGGFVQSIDGLSGGSDDGRRSDWFFYVNGIESPVGAAEYAPGDGDRVWWDYRDWSTAMRVPAVVGSWPEPFVHGFEDERWSAGVFCGGAARPCARVSQALEAEGIEHRRRGRRPRTTIPARTARSASWSAPGRRSPTTPRRGCWRAGRSAAASSRPSPASSPRSG